MKLQEYLSEHSVAFEVLPHEDTFDAQHLAHAVHVPGRMVAKTVLLRVAPGDGYAVAVLPAPSKVDFAAAAKLLGAKEVRLATETEIAFQCPDCEPGALPPFGSLYRLETLVDESLLKAEQLVFEANTHHEAIRMACDDFMNLEKPRVERFAQSA